MALIGQFYSEWRDKDNTTEVVTSAGTVGATPPALTSSEGKFTLAFGGAGLNVGRTIKFGTVIGYLNGPTFEVRFKMSGAIAGTIDFQVGAANQITGTTSNSDGDYIITCTLNGGYTGPEFTIYSTDVNQADVVFSQVIIQGNLHDVILYQEGGVAAYTEIEKKQTTPVVIRRRGEKSLQTDRHILGSELQFNFLVAEADLSTYDAIFQSEYKEWRASYRINEDQQWTGWLLPENYSRPWTEDNYYGYSLSASDGLARLKEIEFKNFTTGGAYSDRVSIITTIKRALEHTEINLDFRVQLGTNCTNDSLMASTECALDKVTIDNRRFNKTVDGRVTHEDCYSIIEKLLSPFNCYLMQHAGKYWIVNAQEKSSYYFPITWTGLTVGTRTAQDLAKTLTDYKYRRNSELQKIRPLETVEVTFRDHYLSDNLLSNGDFSSGTTGWNSTGFFSGISAASGYGEVFSLYASDSSHTTYIYTDNEAITKVTEGDQILVRFSYRLNSFSGTAGAEPLMYVRLWDGVTEHQPLTQSGNIAIYLSTSFTEQEFTFNFPGGVGTNNWSLRIYILARTTPGPYVSAGFNIDDVYWTTVYVDGNSLTFDRFYGINNTDSLFTDTAKAELYFGDSLQDNDIGSLKIGSTRTETWDRYGKTEDGLIQVLSGQNIIENFSRYKDYIRVTIFDETYNILPYSLLNVDSKDYQIISAEEIYAAGMRREITCEAIEVLNTAVTTSISSQSLTTIDSESTGDSSSAVIPAGSTINDSSTSSTSTWSSTKITAYVPTTLQEVTDGGATTDNNISVVNNINNGIGFLINNQNSGASASAAFTLTSDGGSFYFLRSSTTNSTWGADDVVMAEVGGGDIVFSLSTTLAFSEKARLTNAGDLGIGDSTPSYKLDVNGTGRFVQDLTTDADMTADSFATTNVDIETGGTYIIDATGTISATDFRSTSDITKKKNIEPIGGPLDILKKLNGIKFDWKDTGKSDYGLIAQLVEKVLPDVVSKDDAGIMSINYNSFIAILIEAIKALEKRIKQIENDTSS